MKRIVKILGVAFSYLLYKWLIVLIQLIKRICLARARTKQEKAEVPRRVRKAFKGNCVPIRHPNYHRPDPMIYSQHYLMKQGIAVTWDNPDIQLYLNGLPISSHALQPDTEYEVVARCWNLSYDAPVVGMPVKFTYLDFGAGTSNNAIGQTFINLGVIGGSDNPSYAKVKWRTPGIAGHYCIQAKLEWSDDKNPDNNLGQENVNVVESHSPAVFEFKVKNDSKRTHNYRVEADTYTIQPLLSCDEKRKLGNRADEFIQRRNSRENFPIPEDWMIDYDYGELLAIHPQEVKTVKVSVTPPGYFAGQKPFNFNVFDEENTFIGGVTIIITKN